MKMSFIRYKASRDILWLTRFANELMNINVWNIIYCVKVISFAPIKVQSNIFVLKVNNMQSVLLFEEVCLHFSVDDHCFYGRNLF
jgi:hypothetical protein